MTAIGELSDDDALLIKLSCTNKIEAFSPPIFAAYCSKNGAACIERLARYKRLIGPMRFIVTKDAETMTVVIEGDDEELTQPIFLVSCEIAFLTHIVRRATKEEISPVSVEMRELPKENALSEFLNCPINKGKVNAVTYKLSDLLLPFISYDEGMWSYFEPELTKRLTELDNDKSTSARVRSVLSELLPGGQSSIEDVAEQVDRGNYDFVLSYDKNDELGRLTRSFKNLSDDVKAHINDLNGQVFIDALTHVKNKEAFSKVINDLQEQIDKGTEDLEFAVGVFDCDNLKVINDRYGHDKGDIYLKSATRLICQVFQHSPVFRIGGDEFTVILRNEDYCNMKLLRI